MINFTTEQIRHIVKELKLHCKLGHSLFSFVGEVGLSFDEWAELVERHPEVKKDIEIAQSHEVKYWEEALANALEGGDTKAASIASRVLSERGNLFEKVYKKNISTTAPNEMLRRRMELANPIRNRDILDENKKTSVNEQA